MISQNFAIADQIVDVTDWGRAEEVPTGSRAKLTVIQPESGQSFIFKEPKERREHQVWSELLASFIAGDLLDWDVQQVAIARRGERVGNLLTYIFEPGDRRGDDGKKIAQDIFFEGWKFCTEVMPNFDVGKGTKHTWPLLTKVCDELLVSTYGLERDDFFDFWARAFALDGLISNVDRHAENWAVMQTQGICRMAALYDHGSSLGCMIDQIGLDRAFDANGSLYPLHMEKMRTGGKHHVRAVECSKKGSPFEEICCKFLDDHPEGLKRFQEVASLDLTAVSELMQRLGELSPLPNHFILSERRQQHICAMLQIGLERIRNIVRDR